MPTQPPPSIAPATGDPTRPPVAPSGTPPRGSTYAEAVRAMWADTGIWSYLEYDADGDLWLGGLRVRDAVRRFGAPLEIVDTTMIERRCREWIDLTRSVAREIGYRGRMRFHYAAKANMASEVAHAAYRSGWGAETSSRQDLVHLVWMVRRGLVRPDIRVLCNGFKLPADRYSLPGGAGDAVDDRASASRSAGDAFDNEAPQSRSAGDAADNQAPQSRGAGDAADDRASASRSAGDDAGLRSSSPVGLPSAPPSGLLSGPPSGPSVEPVLLPETALTPRLRDVTYADAILDLARDGWDIVPILDTGEVAAFAAAGARMSVGLRLKCGRAGSLSELDGLVSRFGMDRRTIADAAAEIARSPQLTLTTLHTMVGAAESIPVAEFVRALLVAAEVWVDLRRQHSTLTEINMGGGVPPLGEPYDHRAFVAGYLSGLAALARANALPEPDVTFELGSLVAAESACHVFRVLQDKRNHVGRPGDVDEWSILDGGLMAAIPDMLLIGKSFRCLAVEGGTRPARRVRLGDVTCDSDGRYPPEAFGDDESVLLPVSDGPQHVLIQGVGAYQEILAGVRGAHHCGLLEAAELILERRADGRVHGRLQPRQTPAAAATVLGYTDASEAALRATSVAPGG